MIKKSVIAVSLVLALVLASSLAFAHGSGRSGGGWDRGQGSGHMYERGGMRGHMSGYGRGHMDGYGRGHMGGGWSNFDQNDPRSKVFQETAKERNEIQRKHLELKSLWLAEELDEAKIKAVQAEINELRNGLSNRMMGVMIEFKKTNPDWQPHRGGFGGGGRGRMGGGYGGGCN